MYAVYLIIPKHNKKRMLYIGCTNDLTKRLREHNQEKKGGAKYTKHGSEWRYVLCVYGFETHREALQFEWAWTHHFWSVKIKSSFTAFANRHGVSLARTHPFTIKVMALVFLLGKTKHTEKLVLYYNPRYGNVDGDTSDFFLHHSDVGVTEHLTPEGLIRIKKMKKE